MSEPSAPEPPSDVPAVRSEAIQLELSALEAILPAPAPERAATAEAIPGAAPPVAQG